MLTSNSNRTPMKSKLLALALVLAATPLFAQNLPPALQAAVNSGNQAAITQAINTLSGGNAQQAASLATAVAARAEALLATNPQAGIAAAQAAVNAVSAQNVGIAAPTQVQTVMQSVARILANPTATQMPGAVGLATSALSAASVPNSGVNTTTLGSLTVQASALAERLVATNPGAAIQIASYAINAVNNSGMQQGAPADVIATASAVSRVITQSSVQTANPALVGQVAVTLSKSISSPQVLNSNTQAVATIMNNARLAASQPAVQAAYPQAAQLAGQGSTPVNIPTNQQKGVTANNRSPTGSVDAGQIVSGSGN